MLKNGLRSNGTSKKKPSNCISRLTGYIQLGHLLLEIMFGYELSEIIEM